MEWNGINMSGKHVVIKRARVHLAGCSEDIFETEFVGDSALQLGKFVGVSTEQIEHVLAGADRALDAARWVAVQQLLDSMESNQQLVGGIGKTLAESRHLGRNVVGASSDRLVGVLHSTLRDSRERSNSAVTNDLQPLQHLVLLDVLRQVAASHAFVNVLVAGKRVEFLDSRLHVVSSHALPFGDGLRIHLVDDRAVGIDHLVRIVATKVDAQIALRLQNSDPELALSDDFSFWRPDVDHLCACVTAREYIFDRHWFP